MRSGSTLDHVADDNIAHGPPNGPVRLKRLKIHLFTRRTKKKARKRFHGFQTYLGQRETEF